MSRQLGRIVLCRGCCCGVATGRSQGAAHRLERLETLKNSGFEVTTSECLGPCALGDMLVFVPGKEVANPGAAGRPVGRRRPLWFMGMHLDSLNELFIEWILSDQSLADEKFGLLRKQQYQPKNDNRKAINEHLSCVS